MPKPRILKPGATSDQLLLSRPAIESMETEELESHILDPCAR